MISVDLSSSSKSGDFSACKMRHDGFVRAANAFTRANYRTTTSPAARNRSPPGAAFRMPVANFTLASDDRCCVGKRAFGSGQDLF